MLTFMSLIAYHDVSKGGAERNVWHRKHYRLIDRCLKISWKNRNVNSFVHFFIRGKKTHS